MTDHPEIDIDAILANSEVWPTRPTTAAAGEATPAATSAGPAAAVENPAAKVDAPATSLIAAIVFRSRSGGKGHVVTVLEWKVDGEITTGVLCNCEAAASLVRRPAGCWAMKATRAIIGIEEPTA